MNIEELDNYYQTLCDKLDSKQFDVVLNNDRAHNTTIMRAMLEKSQTINMYCGEMSVFRTGFYSHINKNNPTAGTEQLGDHLKNKIASALQGFIKRPNSELNIYFERFDDSYLQDVIDEEIFRSGRQQNKINLFKLDDSLFLKTGIAHTSYTPDSHILRIERDAQAHEAVCGLNIPDNILELVSSTFTKMASAGKKIEYHN